VACSVTTIFIHRGERKAHGDLGMCVSFKYNAGKFIAQYDIFRFSEKGVI
jgi:hypothetical protein